MKPEIPTNPSGHNHSAEHRSTHPWTYLSTHLRGQADTGENIPLPQLRLRAH